MSEGLTALASENLNPSIRSLLEDVQKGHIRVPRFQRPFVWSDSQRLELLRSIRDNMPIGSLLVWRTVKFKLASFPDIGPHSIPPISAGAPATGWQYLLDGHQRVSTLLGLLFAPSPVSTVGAPVIDSFDPDIRDWDIQYDLLDEDFVFRRKADRLPLRHPLLPLWTLLDGRLVNKHMRDLRRMGETHGWTEAEMDEWEQRADQLSYRFQQCRVPIVVMVSDNLELAAKTFQRINSLGTPMGEAHLVAALTWRSDFDLREQIDRLRQTLPLGWRGIDESLVLQVCKGISGLDITKAGQEELVKKLAEDPNLLERAGSALRRVLEWLASDMNVVREDLLPYALQAVMMAAEVDRRSGDSVPDNNFAGWFWRTCWSEVFSSATYREVRAEQLAIEPSSEGARVIEWKRDDGLPERFDFRSARVRLFTLRLATRAGLCDAKGRPVDGRRLLQEYGRTSLVRLLPVPRNGSARLKQLLQGPGNRILLDPADEKPFRERLLKGPDLLPSTLAAHFIDEQALGDLRTGNTEGFLASRQRAMDEWDQGQWAVCRESLSV